MVLTDMLTVFSDDTRSSRQSGSSSRYIEDSVHPMVPALIYTHTHTHTTTITKYIQTSLPFPFAFAYLYSSFLGLHNEDNIRVNPICYEYTLRVLRSFCLLTSAYKRHIIASPRLSMVGYVRVNWIMDQ